MSETNFEELEAALVDYDGEDRMISSLELAERIGDEAPKVIPTGIGSLDAIIDGAEPGELIVVTGPSGEGKCLGRGTEVIMFDGHKKKVEDIVVGDLLMGKDSTPRRVLALGGGKEQMYKVTPMRGKPFVCNESHILSVVRHIQRKTDGVKHLEPYTTTISVRDYLNLSETQKSLTRLYRVPVDWDHADVTVDPYFLGLWLGDGHSNGTLITTADKEIVDYLYEYAALHEMKIVRVEQANNKSSIYRLSKGWRNDVLLHMKLLGVINNKHIPHVYKANSRLVRLNMLAGLLDSDGYVNRTGYVFSNKNKQLAQDVEFLAQSLGLFASIGTHYVDGTEYYKVYISGDCSVIPVKIARKAVPKRKINKDILLTNIKTIEPVGVDDYYGVVLGDDHEYLLGDFTVTHNTTMLMSITQNLTEKSAWFTLEVTPQQFIRKMKARGVLPEFYVPNENTESHIKWLEERIIESVVKYNTRIIFIDHIHMIMSLAKYQQNISLEIGDLVQRIKQLAIKYGLVIFLIAHCLDNKTAPTAEIRKEDIRDSGMIIRIADTILGVWRIRNDDDVDVKRRPNDLDENDNKAKVRVLKNRKTGKLGAIALYHYDHYLTEHDPRYPYDADGNKLV